MEFSAQQPQENPLPLPPPPSLDTNQMVRQKYQTVKEKGEPRISLIKRHQPNKSEQYDALKNKFKELLACVKDGDNPEIDEFLPLIFGVLESSSSQVDHMLTLTQQFGEGIQNLKIEEMVKERIKVVHYGVDKRKGTSLYEVDKKAFDSLATYYDIGQIKAHIKKCKEFKNYIKSWRKFKGSIQDSDEIITEVSPIFKNYVDFLKEELNFNNSKLQPLGNSEKMINQQEKLETTPLKVKKMDEKKDNTASTHKGENENNVPEVSKKKRRTKEEIQQDRLLKQQEKEKKRIQKEELERQKQLKKEEERREKQEKERQKELEKEQQRKAKEEEKQAKQRAKQLEKEAKQKERLEKEEQKRKKEEEKKKSQGKSLYNWFKPKNDEQSSSKQEKVEDIGSEHCEKLESEEHENFITTIKAQMTPISECRSQFFVNKMKDENSRFQPYYVNIFTHKSRLEFTNFLILEQKLKDYTLPHEETDVGKYDDSSVEYEDLCGDVCNEEVDVMSVEEEESEENSAIVPDSFFEVGELSQESKDDVVVNIDRGGEWSFASMDHDKANEYEMFCLFEETFPLLISEPEQSKQLTVSIKCELYKEIHGSCGTKEALVKELVNICDKVPKSYLFNLIRQTTTKKGHQRLVKPEIIDFLNEQKEGFSQELDEIKAKRDEEIRMNAREKVTEKQKELERLILEEAGTYYIVDLLQFLRGKGYRITKKDLIAFIEARVGDYWDDIRRKMGKMQVKEREKMSKFLKKEKEEQAEEKKGEEIKEKAVIFEEKEVKEEQMIPE